MSLYIIIYYKFFAFSYFVSCIFISNVLKLIHKHQPFKGGILLCLIVICAIISNPFKNLRMWIFAINTFVNFQTKHLPKKIFLNYVYIPATTLSSGNSYICIWKFPCEKREIRSLGIQTSSSGFFFFISILGNFTIKYHL